MMPYLIAFWGGILSFFSPCILPLIPAYLSVISGISASELLKNEDRNLRNNILIGTLFFVSGFVIVFSLMGLGASFIGSFLLRNRIIFQKIIAVVLIILGLHTLNFFNIKWLNYEKRLNFKRISINYFSAFIFGCAFALGWSPCIGPILGGILAMAATSGILSKGFFLLFFYSLGLGLPFFVAALFASTFFGFISKHKNIFFYIERLTGILIIVLGFCLFFDKINYE